MSEPRRPRQGASCLGTSVVVIAVAVIVWRAAADLRRAVTPVAPAAPATASGAIK